MTYDNWKTTNPADNELGDNYIMGECDSCGRWRPITECTAFGISGFHCDECLSDPDAERERQRDDKLWDDQ